MKTVIVTKLGYEEVDMTPEEVNVVQAEEERLALVIEGDYVNKRVNAYPSIAEQLDMQYWDSVNGTTTWADAIAAVKAANPKPE